MKFPLKEKIDEITGAPLNECTGDVAERYHPFRQSAKNGSGDVENERPGVLRTDNLAGGCNLGSSYTLFNGK